MNMQAWRPKLALSPALVEQIRRTVTPYMGKRRGTKRLCAKVRGLIALDHPDHRIEVVDKTSVVDCLFRSMSLGVIVDGVPDQGIVVTARKPVAVDQT